MVVVSAASGGHVEVHQLLCGREIANTAANVLFSFAAQMANYIYVVVCKKSRHAVLIDPCWDVNGLLKYCKDSLNVSKVFLRFPKKPFVCCFTQCDLISVYLSCIILQVFKIYVVIAQPPPRRYVLHFSLIGISITPEGNCPGQWLGVAILHLKD